MIRVPNRRENIMFEQQMRAENFFLKDICALRTSAREVLDNVPVRNKDIDVHQSIALLQTVLTAEIVCVLRYTMISVSHNGLRNGWIGAEFQEQANDERKHMKMAAERIEQLGGIPNFNPEGLDSRIAMLNDYDGDFARQLQENLVVEQNVIEHYRDLIGYFSDGDPESCKMLEDIIRDEENHTNDIYDLLGPGSVDSFPGHPV
jgi:bacterioferritin